MAKTRKERQTWVLFWVTFLVSLIIITYFIKSMSPNVDVEIGTKYTKTEQNESESDVKQAIDDRLRWIQMEDNMPGVSKREDGINTSEEKEESVTANKKEQMLDAIEYINPKPIKLSPPTPTTPKQTTSNQDPFKMTKVYVGSYTTIEQAIQAQNKLMTLTTSVSPFVKEIDGKYVLQAGSFANPTKAESIAKEINTLGFSTKIVKE